MESLSRWQIIRCNVGICQDLCSLARPQIIEFYKIIPEHLLDCLVRRFGKSIPLLYSLLHDWPDKCPGVKWTAGYMQIHPIYSDRSHLNRIGQDGEVSKKALSS